MIDRVLLFFNEVFLFCLIIYQICSMISYVKCCKTFVPSECSQIQFSKRLEMLKQLEITTQGEIAFTWKPEYSCSCPFRPIGLTSYVLQ